MGKNWIWQLAIVLLIGAAFILFLARGVDITLLGTGLKQANLLWLALAAIILFCTWLLEACALSALTVALPFRTSFHTTMVGQLFNQITPMASGGQPAQLYMLTKRGMDGGRATSILLMKFLVFQIMLVLSFSVILLFGYPTLAQALPNMKMFILIGYAIHASIIAILILVMWNIRLATFLAHVCLKPVRLVSLEKANAWSEKLDQAMIHYHQQSHRLAKNNKQLFFASLFTCLQLLLFFSIPYFIIQAFHIENVSLFISTAYHAFVMMFASVIPTPGGSGAAEYTFSQLFNSVMSAEMLVLCLFFWRLLTAYVPVFVGLLIGGFIGKKHLRKKRGVQ
ncbi:lysylphosphatidylglycerol synthase transmembrane domain-containing protein [Bacillus sp. JCM 19041]|uniref:lysylphosphatidylglycerol synthase transmembrane domain-containing protein n=1 Tax=Bacillus sp. JCM 19041 TaxID=1460637 RepID=UPI0006CFC745